MKAIPLLLLFLTGCLVSSLHGQSEFMNRIENGGASVNIPQDWASQASREPVVLMVLDMQGGSSLVVVRESKRVARVKGLQAYFDANLAKILGSWEAPNLSDTQAVTGSGQVLWKEGTATLVDPRRNKFPARVLLAAAEGKEHYYLMLITDRGRDGGDGALARQILSSFKVK